MGEDFGSLFVSCAKRLGFVQCGSGTFFFAQTSKIIGGLDVFVSSAGVNFVGAFGGDNFCVAEFFVGVAPEFLAHSGV